MKKLLTNPYFLLVVILIIAAFFRLYNLTQLPPGLYPDEAMDGTNAQEALATGQFKVFYPENNGREGLFMNIQAVSISIFGNEPWALRLVSSLFGIFTVLGMYFFAKQLFHPLFFTKTTSDLSHPDYSNRPASILSKIKPTNVALLAAFFTATSFWHINFSRISFRAIMAPFFAVWAFYFLLKALNHEKHVLSSILGGIFFGLGFYSYIAFRPLPILAILIALLYWWEHGDKIFRKKILTISLYFIVATFIVALPLGIYFLQHPQDFFGRTSELSITSSAAPLHDLLLNIVKTAGMFNLVGDWNWRHNLAGRPELFLPVGLLLLFGLFLGIKHTSRNWELRKKQSIENFAERNETKAVTFASIVSISWFIVAALPVVISNEGIPHALRSMLMIPPVMAIAGFGGVWLYELAEAKVIKYSHSEIDFKQKRARRNIFLVNIGAVLFCILLVLSAYTSYFILWGQNVNVQYAFNSLYADIGRLINTMPDNQPKYVIVQATGVSVRGIPMPSQTVMFLTDTFTPDKQAAKNIHYILPDQVSQIPANAFVVTLR